MEIFCFTELEKSFTLTLDSFSQICLEKVLSSRKIVHLSSFPNTSKFLMDLTHITSKSSDNIFSSKNILIQGFQSSEKAPEQNFDACENDVFLKWIINALFLKRRIGYQTN